MTGADSDTELVEPCAHCFIVGGVQHEGKHACLRRSRTDKVQTGYFAHFGHCVLKKLMLVLVHGGHANGVQIFQRGAESNSVTYAACSGFKLVRSGIVDSALKGNVLYHISAAVIRAGGFKQLGLSVQCADTGGSKYLVSGEDEEIRIHCRHVHGYMSHRLSAVYQNAHAVSVSYGDKLLHRSHRAENIRYLSNADEFRAAGEKLLVFRKYQLTTLIAWYDFYDSTGLLADELPWNYVRVVLEN